MKRYLGLVMLMGLVAAPAAAEVDLEWRLEEPVDALVPGSVVRIGLYAVADTPTDGPELVSAMDVLVQWDPDVLVFQGLDDNGPYPWYFSGFYDDGAGDGINETFDDGTAYYSAWADLFTGPAQATPDGLLVTTFVFEVASAAPQTQVSIPAAMGTYSYTAVWSGEIPGLNIVGDLFTLSVPEGAVTCFGDLDGDGAVGPGDMGILLGGWGAGGASDLDGDGTTGPSDLGELLAHWGACP